MVGEATKLDEERRDKLGDGEPALFCTDRSEAVDDCFFNPGVDFRRSSRNDVELAVRRGVDRRSLEADRGVASAGDSREEDDNEGETGCPLGECGSRFIAAEKAEVNGRPSWLEGSMMQGTWRR